MLKSLIKRAIFETQKIFPWTPISFNGENLLPVWMQEQIEKDLEGVKKGKCSFLFERADLIQKHKLMGIQIRNHRVKTKGYIEIERTYPVLNAVRALAPWLDDLTFFVSFKDHLNDVDWGVPLFVFAKNPTCASHILMPDFEALTGYHHISKAVQKGNVMYPWEQKETLCYWRGRTTGKEFTANNFFALPRAEIVALSQKFPSCLDARFTEAVQCPDPKEIQKNFCTFFTEPVSIEEQIRYKYQLVLDGNTCPYSKLYWGFISNCCVFRQQSSHLQWYYAGLQPKKHYIEVNKNLISQIQWARKHDREVKEIAKASQKFAQENLNLKKNLQYFYQLLKQYSKRFSREL